MVNFGIVGLTSWQSILSVPYSIIFLLVKVSLSSFFTTHPYLTLITFFFIFTVLDIWWCLCYFPLSAFYYCFVQCLVLYVHV